MDLANTPFLEKVALFGCALAWVLPAWGCSAQPGVPVPVEAFGGGGAGGADGATGESDFSAGGFLGWHAPMDPERWVVPFEGPQVLSETGLYSDFAARQLAPGVREFDIAYPLWSDGALKRRFLSLPPGTQIDSAEMDAWRFPTGTKAWKEFHRDGVLVETRYLEKVGPELEGWLHVAYVWNDAGTEAVAEPSGVTDAGGTPHDVPDQRACWDCHSGSQDFLLGVSALQLSRKPSETAQSSLLQFAEAGIFSEPPAHDFTVPGDGVVPEVLGYLHGNCGSCHSDDYYLANHRKLRFRLRVGDKRPEDTPTYQTALGTETHHWIEGTRVAIEPGKPEQSQVYVRMKLRDRFAMPPGGSEEVDGPAVDLVEEWIKGI